MPVIVRVVRGTRHSLPPDIDLVAEDFSLVEVFENRQREESTGAHHDTEILH